MSSPNLFSASIESYRVHGDGRVETNEFGIVLHALSGMVTFDIDLSLPAKVDHELSLLEKSSGSFKANIEFVGLSNEMITDHYLSHSAELDTVLRYFRVNPRKDTVRMVIRAFSLTGPLTIEALSIKTFCTALTAEVLVKTDQGDLTVAEVQVRRPKLYHPQTQTYVDYLQLIELDYTQEGVHVPGHNFVVVGSSESKTYYFFILESSGHIIANGLNVPCHDVLCWNAGLGSGANSIQG